MLMILSTRQVDSGRLLDRREVAPKRSRVMRPVEDNLAEVPELPEVIDHNRMKQGYVITLALVVAVSGDCLSFVQIQSSHRSANGSDTRQPVM